MAKLYLLSVISWITATLIFITPFVIINNVYYGFYVYEIIEGYLHYLKNTWLLWVLLHLFLVYPIILCYKPIKTLKSVLRGLMGGLAIGLFFDIAIGLLMGTLLVGKITGGFSNFLNNQDGDFILSAIWFLIDLFLIIFVLFPFSIILSVYYALNLLVLNQFYTECFLCSPKIEPK